ncbi:MAG: energy transducer TonB [Candidatus Eremiobacteraeota bacterium]|nr:energy transducer TonB [Candidatus Eremiobacteraeota bacterium]
MKRFSVIVASATAAVFAIGTLPATAQYANEYVPAKLLKQGTTTKGVAGSGTVVVQVQVNADGTHKAIKVIKTTNAGDNDAAMDIAQNSTYKPAHRGTKPIVAFYDFTLKFNGKFAQQSGPSFTPAQQKIADLIQQKQYAQAQTAAQTALAAAPDDDTTRQLLGIAAFDAGDPVAAAQAFDRVDNVASDYQQVAAAAFAAAAVSISQTQPTQSLAYAQKAYAITPDTNTRFALGVAQLSNKQYADAVNNLKAAHDAAMKDSSMTPKVKVNIDSMLLTAYLDQKDTANATAIASEIKQIDPSSTAAQRALATSQFNDGKDAAAAKQYDAALKDFDAAAAQGDPQVAVTAYVQAAFTIANMDKPDYKRMLSYADKALALSPDDAGANFAEGFGLIATNGDKDKAKAALLKADAQAKKDGNTALASNIENFMKAQNIGQ